MARMTLEDAYLIYCTQGKGRDGLWMEVHFQSTISLNRLIKKTGVRLPAEDKADLLTDIDCRVMKKLDKKLRIGNIKGMIYFAASTELENLGSVFAGKRSEIELSECHNIATYQCSHPGCPEILREPGFCKEHSPKPRVYGVLLTIDQACDQLGISRMGLYRLINAKKIKPTKVQGRTLIGMDEVLRISTPCK